MGLRSRGRGLAVVVAFGLLCSAWGTVCAQTDAVLPPGVRAVWDMGKAARVSTPTRERVCINGLWRWQPADAIGDRVPSDNWGFCKVPAAWTDTSQDIYPHPAWQAGAFRQTNMAWYQREITIPADWKGRRIAFYTEYLNSYAVVFVDGKSMGRIGFPGGEVDITAGCEPGRTHTLTLGVEALPLAAEVAVFNDTMAPGRARGNVERRGLCGDSYLESTPAGARLSDAKVDTSVRKWEVAFDVALDGLDPNASYRLRASVGDDGTQAKESESAPFRAADLKEGRFTFSAAWHPDKLWDIDTPQNMYDAQVSLVGDTGQVLDAFRLVRFGFREFWIDGRDFYLNGTRVHCFACPIDNCQLGAPYATYAACRETLSRMKASGVTLVYTHNYGSLPGMHLSFEGLMRAADDVGVLVAVSQPHYGHYNWSAPDAEKTNGYVRHAEFYVRRAENHPSVVMYATNHNAFAYAGAWDPDLMDGKHNADGKLGPRDDDAAQHGLLVQHILERLDPTRVVYHHHSGALGNMFTLNLYLDFVPIRERSDWFEHWATEGVMPLFLVEYGVPWDINWTTYRGWYNGVRAWGSAKAPYEFTMGEWNSQFLGDAGFDLTDKDEQDVRWEAQQWRAGRTWYKWDYPYQPSPYYSWGHPNQDRVWAMYITDNWRAFRTWGLSAWTAWGWDDYWELRPGIVPEARDLKVDWDGLQQPDYSPDHVDGGPHGMETGLERSDWVSTAAAKALLRNTMPLLAYIGGKPERFTTEDHNFLPGQSFKKQLIIINDSRVTVDCDCTWSLDLPQPLGGSRSATVKAGEQARIPLEFTLPVDLKPGAYALNATVRFSTGETQTDTFEVDVLAPPLPVPQGARIALFDPKGETAALLRGLGVACQAVDAEADLGGYDELIIGKQALTVDGSAPDVSRVRDGLKVIMFEQTAEVLEKRFGFRTEEYGLRRVFERVPDHPILAGLADASLRDWAGDATILPDRLTGYTMRPRYGSSLDWCGITLPRAYRAGNWGNVASVLIEKPARGNFLPIVDGGYSLQYSPLMEYREGKGLVLLCQMDVTGRSDPDAAAARLVSNILSYVASYSPPPVRKAVYAGPDAGRRHLEQMGLALGAYAGGGLKADDVLVLGPGAGKTLSGDADALRQWVQGGGNVLAIGLSGEDAGSILPISVRTEKAEHISTVFAPPGRLSLLAGVGPADVMDRDPQVLDLVASGATVVGDGVLAVAPDANIAFCQLAPWDFDYAKYFNQKRTFRRASLVLTRVLGNMGVAEPTPLLTRVSSPVGAEEMEGRWLDGFYLDKPEEMDDPYRYFQW
jgi:beta-galactosidase